MLMRKAPRILSVLGALTFVAAACGDKTVVGSPAVTSAPSAAILERGAAGTPSDAVDAFDAPDLAEIDQLLREIEADLGAVNQDAITPEGDPTE